MKINEIAELAGLYVDRHYDYHGEDDKKKTRARIKYLESVLSEEEIEGANDRGLDCVSDRRKGYLFSDGPVLFGVIYTPSVLLT
ncbi:hypothetical protein ABE28_013205 [Peribacillus muralis]|uniref:Uncharacterized protein n=1 Tax=Peribacillus muralis TaxID=264697 RepID=A0A1B3XQ33_9BACI|nr:hypothetical protein [Peribacillus muralis]AOH55311.1 hypothetical protein ABE28_013205 [Peribacillus muralis]